MEQVKINKSITLTLEDYRYVEKIAEFEDRSFSNMIKRMIKHYEETKKGIPKR